MRRAFTVIEIIFVVTIVAILIGIAAPRLLEKDDLGLATDQVINHIRYTQHLALMQDKYKTDDVNWSKGKWQVRFHTSETTDGKWSYSVFSDLPGYAGHPNWGELAVNPLERQRYLSAGFATLNDFDRLTPELCIGCVYGITGVNFSSSCTDNQGSTQSRRISFDEIGRPHYRNPTTNPYSRDRRVLTTCTITLAHQSGDTAQICIEPETGYTHRCD